MSDNAKSSELFGTSSCDSSAKPLVWNSELIQRFWNHHSKSEESYFASQFGEAIIQALWPHLKGRTRVLDYACGTGALTGYLLDKGLHVAACDVSEHSLSLVAKTFGGHERFLGTVNPAELDAHAGTFEVVMLIELIEHVDDSQLMNIFHEVKRVLAPGGVVVVTTPNEENLMTETVYCPQCNHTFHRWQHIRSWSAESLGKLFWLQGLQAVKIFTTDFSLSRHDGWLRYMARKIARSLTGRKHPHLVGIAHMPLR